MNNPIYRITICEQDGTVVNEYYTDEDIDDIQESITCSVACYDTVDALNKANEDTEPEDNMTDAEADADVLKSAGWGTDEDYGYYGNEE